MLNKTGIIVKHPHTHSIFKISSFIYKTSHSLSPASGRLAHGHPADSNSAAKFSLEMYKIEFFLSNLKTCEKTSIVLFSSKSSNVQFFLFLSFFLMFYADFELLKYTKRPATTVYTRFLKFQVDICVRTTFFNYTIGLEKIT